MARVHIPQALHGLTRGAACVEVSAANVRELLDALESRFPGIREHLDQGMAVAIDGDIIQQPLLEPIGASSEVHFLPSISGG